MTARPPRAKESTAPAVRHVCIGVDEFHPMGGTERQAVELAVELRAQGLAVDVISRWPAHARNVYVEELREAGVCVHASGWHGLRGGRLRRLSYLRARVRQGVRPDYREVERLLWNWQVTRLRTMRGPGFVLHEMPFFGVVSVHGRRTLNALDLPIVVTAFGSMPGIVPDLDISGAIVTTDGRLPVDPAQRQEWIPSMGPRGLVTSAAALEREPSGVVVFGGRLVVQKGVDVLIEAMASLPSHRELVVAGYGPERERLDELARSLGVRVRFPGPLPAGEFFDLVKGADLLVVPSLGGEGVPTVVVEALAAGTPVVASDVGGISRVLEAPFGEVVSPGDSELLAAAILHMLEGPLVERRRAARAAFEERLAPASVVPRYLACYAEALRRHAASATTAS